MKRALALIESKMNLAKGWLKDPNGLPGNQAWQHTKAFLLEDEVTLGA